MEEDKKQNKFDGQASEKATQRSHRVKMFAVVTLGALSRCFPLRNSELTALLYVTAFLVHIQCRYNVAVLGQESLKTIVSKTTG